MKRCAVEELVVLSIRCRAQQAASEPVQVKEIVCQERREQNCGYDCIYEQHR